jgi:hypothetical protein
MDLVHEFASYTFRDGIDTGEQAVTMEKIGAATAGCAGLVSREFFYSEPDRRWLVHLTWASEEAIEDAEAIVEDPAVASLFDQLESESMTYGRFAHAGAPRP